MKNLFILIIVALCAVALAGIYKFNFTNDDVYIVAPDGTIAPYDETSQSIASSFEECVALGFVVMESYPEQCSDGVRTFTRELTPAEQERVTPPSAQIANPASVHCVEQGGMLEIKKDATGGEYGECTLPGGTVCEEWALFRGECE